MTYVCVFVCVIAQQVGAQAGNIGRGVVLSSRLPESVPGTTCDRQCGSSQQAIHQAVQGVMSGTQDIVIAGGVESMSTCPIGSNVMDGMAAGHGFPFNSKGIEARYPGKQFSQFAGAEMLAKKYQLTRAELRPLPAAPLTTRSCPSRSRMRMAAPRCTRATRAFARTRRWKSSPS